MAGHIDLETDELLTLGEACRSLSRKPSPATTWRWTQKGVNGVKLEVVRVGGRLYTSRRAFTEFLRAQNRAPAPDALPTRSETTRRKLEAAGLL
jgi:hypothetical protein